MYIPSRNSARDDTHRHRHRHTQNPERIQFEFGWECKLSVWAVSRIYREEENVKDNQRKGRGGERIAGEE